jgi:hypothetical protein
MVVDLQQQQQQQQQAHHRHYLFRLVGVARKSLPHHTRLA